MRWLSALLVLGACVDMDDGGSGIVGTSGDVTTEPGDYVGYRVVAPCEDRTANLGVIGTGSVELTDTDAIAAAGRDLAATLGDVSSLWSWGGYGVACEPGIGTQLSINNWQDVDMLIVRIGEFLRERDLALQVSVHIGNVPVAH